ncbi:response regulator [Janthinobacterium sp. UMAB-56]|uniref:response regulator n=1 Tax=Janthinobacterium sp. UMAB-56 TaxID=1365361 RepID=UPI001C55EF9F|nr:response regulator [Janthinobacterium sp. UMAB-56]
MTIEQSLLRIMVVDDNRDAADLIAQFLEIYGHHAIPVYGGAEALKTAESFDPDVFFVDLGMPDMDGLQVVSTLRRSAKFQTTKIIALTAWGDDLARSQTKAVGFDHHLVKPANLDEILNLIQKAA